MQPRVQTTKDYSLFKSILGNRFINPAHVEKLADSLSNRNLMCYQPVMVNEKMFIIDGQHRVEAAKKLGIPVHYIIVPKLNLHDIQLLNANMRSWTVRDFAESHARTGNKDYEELLAFTDKYNLPITVAAHLLMGEETLAGGGTASEAIRSGTFEVSSRKEAEDIAERLKELSDFCEGGVWRSRDFIRGLTTFYDMGASHERLLDRLESYPEKVGTHKDHREYLMVLQDIYNYRSRKPNRIDIFSSLNL